MIVPFTVTALLLGMTFIAAAYQDVRERYVNPKTWTAALLIGVPVAVTGYVLLFFSGGGHYFTHFIWYSLGLTVLWVVLAEVRAFGGADAKALIFMTWLVPLFPFAPLYAPSVTYFPGMVLLNSIVFAVVAFVWGITQKGAGWKYRVPLLVPITLGYFTTLVLGDTLSVLFSAVL